MDEQQPTIEQPTIEQLTAERDLWRARYLAAHEVIAAVEQVYDLDAGLSKDSASNFLEAYRVLVDAFNAWRKLVEAGVPTHWQVAE